MKRRKKKKRKKNLRGTKEDGESKIASEDMQCVDTLMVRNEPASKNEIGASKKGSFSLFEKRKSKRVWSR